MEIMIFPYQDGMSGPSVPLLVAIETACDSWICYLGHLRPQVDLSQVDGMRQQVVQQLAQ